MSKLNKAQRAALQKLLAERLSQQMLIPNDDHFWQSVADICGHSDVSKTRTEPALFIGRALSAAKHWLSKLPEVV